ncbi:MSC_0624 family F1-like ATPase-associated membrane protein [Mycoplasma crocodyli]|uniref:Putative membrane protein n=1 Tax=Mycoplasma crocodyli (strain ATCC 51981 / MP145) TaxID=512564 RepID=D5E4T9_MYCCM|nr:hypothetical protein [Mycoplasma crocodyli]ADE19361.1 putative membrane protein [Mycoplasma crocodyli MP145]
MKINLKLQIFKEWFKRQRNLINILKLVIIVALFAFNMALLVKFDKSFFRFGVERNPLYYVLFTNSEKWYQANVVSITSSLIFYIVIVSTLLKNSINLTESKSNAKKYLPIYLIYLFFSIGLMATFFSLDKLQKFINPLFVVAIVAFVYLLLNIINVFIKRFINANKLYPMDYQKTSIILITYIFRFILYFLIALLIYFWTDLLIGNEAIDQNATIINIKSFFKKGTVISTFAFTVLITLVIVLLLGSNLDTIYRLIKKENVSRKYKVYASFAYTILATLVIWIFMHFPRISNNLSLIKPTVINFELLVFPIILLVLFAALVLINTTKIIKTPIYQRLTNLLFVLITWIVILVFELLNKNNYWISLGSILIAILTTGLVGIWEIKNPKNTATNLYMLIALIYFVVIATFINAFSLDLFNNGNYIYLMKHYQLKVSDIINILIVVLALCIVVYNSTTIIKVAFIKEKSIEKITIDGEQQSNINLKEIKE